MPVFGFDLHGKTGGTGQFRNRQNIFVSIVILSFYEGHRVSKDALISFTDVNSPLAVLNQPSIESFGAWACNDIAPDIPVWINPDPIASRQVAVARVVCAIPLTKVPEFAER